MTWETIDFNNHQQVCRFLRRQSDRITELENENKHLKRALKTEEEEAEVYNLDAMSYQTLYKQQLEKNQKLIKENEQLKKENKELIGIIDEIDDGEYNIP